jgi:hypothetical protein
MRQRGPYLTLVAGLLIAAVITGLSVNAFADAKAEAARQAAPAAPAPTTAPAAEPPPAASPPAASPPPARKLKAVYAGRVDGGAATVAVSVKGNRAIAYVCDGKRVEAWMSGTVTGTQLELTGEDAALSATIRGSRLAGTVEVKAKNWAFDVPQVRKPSGLYQAARNVAGARVVGSWIVLPDGSQVGVLVDGGEPGPAPEFDPDSGEVSVSGGSLLVLPVAPDGG